MEGAGEEGGGWGRRGKEGEEEAGKMEEEGYADVGLIWSVLEERGEREAVVCRPEGPLCLLPCLRGQWPVGRAAGGGRDRFDFMTL